MEKLQQSSTDNKQTSDTQSFGFAAVLVGHATVLLSQLHKSVKSLTDFQLLQDPKRQKKNIAAEVVNWSNIYSKM